MLLSHFSRENANLNNDFVGISLDGEPIKNVFEAQAGVHGQILQYIVEPGPNRFFRRDENGYAVLRYLVGHVQIVADVNPSIGAELSSAPPNTFSLLNPGVMKTIFMNGEMISTAFFAKPGKDGYAILCKIDKTDDQIMKTFKAVLKLEEVTERLMFKKDTDGCYLLYRKDGFVELRDLNA